MGRGDEISDAHDLVPRLGEVTAPALILAGRHDLSAPPSRAELLRAGILNAESVVLEESGHFPYLEEPEECFAAIRAWLRRMGSGA